MKIAVVSDDQKSINQHFGRAKHYVVYSIGSGNVLSKETRSKSVHHNTNTHSDDRIAAECHYGYGISANVRHKSIIDTVSDCAALIAGCMDWGAYESLKNHNIDTVITDVIDADQAVDFYLTDNLPNLIQRLH